MRWIVLTGLIVMALAGALMLYRQGEKAVASQDWRRVQGTVTESLVDRRAARSNERQWDYKAIIHYRYEVDGRPYAGTQRRFPNRATARPKPPRPKLLPAIRLAARSGCTSTRPIRQKACWKPVATGLSGPALAWRWPWP